MTRNIAPAFNDTPQNNLDSNEGKADDLLWEQVRAAQAKCDYELADALIVQSNEASERELAKAIKNQCALMSLRAMNASISGDHEKSLSLYTQIVDLCHTVDPEAASAYAKEAENIRRAREQFSPAISPR